MKHQLLGLIAETSLHAGAGRAVGVIDLPIQREATTGWPCVYGSAMKGSMRAKAESQQASWVVDVFGPDTRNASDHAGALAVGDARLLLLPVRSLTSHFKWVTCPALVQRALADARRAGLSNLPNGQLPALVEDQALHASPKGSLYLEEFRFQAAQHDLQELIEFLAGFVDDAEFAQKLNAQLVIVSNDWFAHLAAHATPVAPHIAIDNSTKTVKGGALWYEESLPPETVLYVVLAASASRRDARLTASEMLEQTLSLFPAEAPYLQIGGNETVGMGWCRVNRVGGA